MDKYYDVIDKGMCANDGYKIIPIINILLEIGVIIALIMYIRSTYGY